jgi:hypothetical protein
MTAHVKLTGSWSNVSDIYSRVGGSWKQVTEGYVKLSGAWKQFFSSGIPLTVNYLVVAGGGGGGSDQGGGGGAGGYRTSAGTSGGGGSAESALTLAVATNYTLTVGAGGTGQTANNGTTGTSGSNSVFSTITSTGGGRGGNGGINNALTGGSGGGGGAQTLASNGAAGTANQGFGGGNGSGTFANAGGGGGAAEAGNTDGTRTGGDGVASSITGTSVTRAGGGSGGSNNGSTVVGGDGGGGTGSGSNANGTTGTTNTGSGGGGGGSTPGVGNGSGGNGGSGVVIIKFPDFYAISVSAGLTHSTVTSGGFRVTTFTAGTGTVSFSQAVANDYVLIGTTYLTSSQASVTFDLTGLSGTYKHLQIRYTARSSNSGTANDGLWLRFNNDSGSNYAWHRLEGNGSSVSSGAGTSATWILMGITPRDGNTANIFAAGICDILEPFTSNRNKTIRCLHGVPGTGNPGIFLGSGFRNNTEAITSLTLFPDAGQSFVANSRFSIYGIKG